MLNLEKLQEVVDKMLESSRKYIEEFWQAIFDLIEFEPEYPTINSFNYNMDCGEDLDDLQVLEDLDFTVSINCYGEITILFDINTCREGLPFRLSAEYLVDNGFVINKDNEMEFVRNIGKI